MNASNRLFANDIVQDFILEIQGSVDDLNKFLPALEERPDDKEALSHIYHVFHSLQGATAFVPSPRLAEIALACGNLMQEYLYNKEPIDPEAIVLLYKAAACIDAISETFILSQREPSGTDARLIQDLIHIHEEIITFKSPSGQK